VTVPRGARAIAAALSAASTILLSGCVPQGLAFRVDDRLTITSPKDRAEVTLPLTVSWQVRDFTIDRAASPDAKDTGYFAVFVDRAPQPPNKPLSWVARKDRTCRASDGCPDEEYLAARGIYTTTDTHITFDQLPRPSNEHQKERHSITVVLLDPAGDRIGESAFQIDVVVRRKGL
jgi:hypothetical protein